MERSSIQGEMISKIKFFELQNKHEHNIYVPSELRKFLFCLLRATYKSMRENFASIIHSINYVLLL